MDDLAPRLSNRVQLTSDGHKLYLEAIEGASGADIDYAMLVKVYGPAPSGAGHYRPLVCIGAKKHCVQGNRHMTRLTNVFSKKAENHAHDGDLLHALQFCSHSSNVENNACIGLWRHSQALGDVWFGESIGGLRKG